MNHVDKYYWIIDHPNIGLEGCQAQIELTPHKVNPENETIETNIERKHLNTAFRWWVELSKYNSIEDLNDGMQTHYYELDCGGETAEEAIDNLYTLVKKHYGDY